MRQKLDPNYLVLLGGSVEVGNIDSVIGEMTKYAVSADKMLR